MVVAYDSVQPEILMSLTPQEPPGVDPDNIPETLCVGKFNIWFGPAQLVTLTFTHARNKTTPLIDNSQIEQESVVRARIVTTAENLVALRDLLNALLKDTPAVAAAATGGSGKLN
jgi:hypothetical protein